MAAAAAWVGVARSCLLWFLLQRSSRRKLGSEPWVRIPLKAVAVRIGLFLWKSYCIADSAFGREMPLCNGMYSLSRRTTHSMLE